jgi:putative ATPase
MDAPLAERMRPVTLDELAGQEHLTGKGSVLRNALQQGRIPSMILWGPPGTGKTTIARILAEGTGQPFHTLSAISAGVKDIREVIQSAREQGNAILFIDEIHRFNKSQQDALLGAVENGTITLIGATTENPSFEVNSALLSRCQVFVLKPLDVKDLSQLVDHALTKDGGDGRKLLNLVEMAVNNVQDGPVRITDAFIQETVQKKIALYDKSGEQHYDIISAFIKSVRGSDPNAAVYWLARMIEGGEDLRFIARRMVVLASEDIGNANPTALVLANAAFEAVDKIGYPEARIILSQCATYLASSPKSNAAYLAIDEALAIVRKEGDLPVPLAIRNAPTTLMKQLGYNEGYLYAHDHPMNFILQEYLPDKISGHAFYRPGQNAREEEMRRFLKERWKGKYGY